MTAKRPPGACAWCGERIPEHYRADRKTCSEKCRGARVRAGNPRRHLSYRYGISPEERDRMEQEQGGRCAICQHELGRRLHVDHDHATGEVRGLLCPACNTALGKFRDDPVRLASAIAYLERTAK